MHIKQLQLKNFRNYEAYQIDLIKGLNFIVGRNAVGKTNILEAIYFLENGKSHRTSVNQELIKWNEDFSYIKASVERKEREVLIEAVIFRTGGRQIKVNGVEIKKIKVLEKPVLTVIFTPDHLKIVKEEPEYRRAYLDEVLGKTKVDYNYWRSQYLKILRQRNMLLKKVYIGNMRADIIDYWDRQLAGAGAKVIMARQGIIKKLEGYANESYEKIAGIKTGLSLTYESQVSPEGEDIETLKEKFLTELTKKRKAEVERGQTLVGPHRDDVGIYVDRVDLRKYGSQGEQRSASLALKTAEFLIIAELTKDHPVMLLDDVMSELDYSRREAFLNQIGTETQAIITSTQVEYLKEMGLLHTNIIRIT
ncbi:MAG: DNA replication/repair protein RecF [Firmicutes bacterium]|nr:DNA replication/repair protein RecF [Bacillota bacterium]